MKVTSNFMKKYLFIIVIATGLINCTSRPKLNNDLMVDELCTAFQNDEVSEPDSIKVGRIFKKHLDPYLTGISQDSIMSLENFFYIRLQKNCVVFRDLTNNISAKSRKGEWQDVDREPESSISEADYKAFFELKKIKYLENTGDTTEVYFTDSTWEDHFLDGTFSRLSLNKTGKDEFVLTFIESNNKSRQYLSKPGDQYRYKLLAKNEKSYSMLVQPVGSKIKSLFKLHF